MASRDVSNFRTVVQSVVENPNAMLQAGAEFAGKILAEGQEAKINENLSKVQLDLNALQTQYQIDNEGNPMGGIEDYKLKRQELFDTYGDQISPFYKKYWNDSVRNISKTNDATQQGWALKQTRVNTVQSINESMKNNFTQANIDGRNFGSSDETEIGAYVNFETSKQHLNEWGTKNLGETTTAEMLSGYDKDYMKSFISGVADSNPAKAANLLKDKTITNMFSPDEMDTFENVIKRNAKRRDIDDLFNKTQNEDQVTDIVNDPNGDYFSKRLQIDTLEFENKISTSTAEKARRVLTSQKNVDAVTSSDEMADIVNQMYDLNAISDSSSEDYLVGVQNVRNDILEKQAAGLISPSDAQKLNSQLRTLTSQRTSQATQNVGMGFYDSNQKFDQLPPQYRGKATRELFYKTNGQDMSPEQIDREATKIIDNIKGTMRADTVQRINKINTPDDDFLKTKGYTMDDVKETAAKYGITEQEVIQKLKAQ